MASLNHRVAIIGAGDGIGAAVAARFAASHSVFARYPELEAAADAANPMGRLGDPLTDIAPVASFLASEDARYLTGNTLFVDGGGQINGVNWGPDLRARSI